MKTILPSQFPSLMLSSIPYRRMEGSWKTVRITLLTLSFLLFIATTCVGASAAPSRHMCRQDQRDALLELKNGFTLSVRPYRDLKWSTPSWKKEVDCCSWDGITCDNKTGVVIGLDLGVNALEGEINSSSSLFRLKNLRTLNLACNDFNFSTISTQYTTFMELTVLNLSQSSFSGQVPIELVQLTKLVSLDLSSNSLSAENSFLDKLVQNLTNLKDLNLGSVDISSEIPRNISKLSHLRSLNLDDCNLIGAFPTSVLSIPSIQSISLRGNLRLEGPLPKFHGNNSLVYLDLSYTSFSGNIPNSISNLKHLDVLSLHNSNFTGLIPSSLGNLSRLTNIRLSGNTFAGEIPSSFGSLNQLTSLGVDANKLGGNFPIVLLNLTKLSYLSLSYNQFTGTLPPNISSLSNLVNFGARQNSFFGTIPSTLLTIPSLEVIDLADNQLNGTLGFVNMSSPPYPQKLDVDNNSSSDLTILYLSNNRITGQVPGWLWSLPKLNDVDLSNNSFSGFGGFTNDFSREKIDVLDLRSNDFQGPLFVPPRPIRILLASRNNFSGEIPITVCDTTSLYILDIANNNLNGSAPQCLWNLTAKSLSVLDISGNHFTGSLPDIFMNATNLRSLNLGHNHFVGKLPKSLTGCSSLEVLNVEHNRLNDTFPFWLQSLKNLKVLILRSNEFHGLLQYHPQGPSWFPQLRIIDLSDNDFTGTLPPDFFMYLSAMSSKSDSPELEYVGGNLYYRDSMVLMNKGVELEYTRIFTLLTAIDLSGNKLEGNIPESIGLLKDLIVLNLSSNGFNGNITSSLGNLTQLESLDLSHNELSGRIPPTLSVLTKLSFIKVSHNELVGEIPRSTQFQTQSASSFEGNLGLCGPPLNEKCGDVDTGASEEDEEEEEEVISWIAAAIGLAPGIIFGLTIGYIVIARKPQWFMVKKKKKTQGIASESSHKRTLKSARGTRHKP